MPISYANNYSSYITSSAPKPALMTLKSIEGGVINITFAGEENGQQFMLNLAAERDITAFEQLQLSILMLSIANGLNITSADLMQFVRQHKLERHFKINV